MKELVNFRIESTIPDRWTVWFDVPDRSVNAISDSVLDDVQVLLDSDPDELPKSICFRSPKISGLAVGADLKKILSVQTDQEIQDYLRRGQELWQRLLRWPVMTIAYIHGACLGGGLEFAMACRFRIASPDSKTKLGMPETKLGLIPGWGGTQRLFDLVPANMAVRMLMTGETLSAQEAFSSGLVDAVCPEGELEEALASIDAKSRSGIPSKELPPAASLEEVQHELESYRPWSASQRTMAKAIESGLRESRQAGMQVEREDFFALLQTNEVQAALARFR